MIKKVLAASFWVSMGILLGRLLGFAREATLAATFGVSSNTDIAVLVLTIPDLLVNLLIAGGLSAALIPEFKSAKSGDVGILFVQSSFFVLAIFIIVVLFLSLSSGWIVYLFAPGMESNTAETAQRILRGVLWLIPLTVLAGVSTAYLQSLNKFAIPALGTVVFNLSVVTGLLFFIDADEGLNILVFFILAGGILRWMSQLWALKGKYSFKGNFEEILLTKHLFHRYWQAVTALGILTLYPVVFRSFASLEGEGELAIVNFAFRLVELPLGVVITVLSIVLFPRLSEFYEKQDHSSFSTVFRKGLFWSVLLASSIAGVMAAGSDVFTSIVYQWGVMTDEEVRKVALLVKVLAVSLPFQAAIVMSISGFNSRKNTKLPMLLSLVGLLVFVPGVFLSVENAGTVGGAVAVVLCYCLVSLLFLINLGKNYLSLEFGLILAVLVIIVTSMAYALTSASKFFFNGSDNAVVFVGAIVVTIMPLIVSMVFREYRQYLVLFLTK